MTIDPLQTTEIIRSLGLLGRAGNALEQLRQFLKHHEFVSKAESDRYLTDLGSAARYRHWVWASLRNSVALEWDCEITLGEDRWELERSLLIYDQAKEFDPVLDFEEIRYVALDEAEEKLADHVLELTAARECVEWAREDPGQWRKPQDDDQARDD